MPIVVTSSGERMELSGRLSIEQAREMHEALSEWLREAKQPELDLGGVEQCDTASLQMIYSVRRSALQAGKTVRLRSVSPAVMGLAEALGSGLDGELRPGEETNGV
jgi:anti-anti-sigma factor